MSTTQKICLSFLSATLFIFACKKDDPAPGGNNNPVGTTYSSIADYFNQNALQGQTFNFLAESGTTYNGAKGSTLTIPPNAFKHSDGSLVTGSVEMELKEVFSNKDQIMAQKFPVSWGSPLNSGGEFFLEARQNGEALAVADGALVDLEIPAQAEDEQMLLFFDAPEELNDSADGGWQVAGEFWETNSSFTFNSADDTYQIELDTCTWGNIDAFLWSVSYFEIDFNLLGVDGLDNSNTTAFALFVDENSVWPTGVSGWGSITGNVIHETHLADVPMNLIVISVVDGQLYSGHLEITPVQGVTYDIQMETTTSDALDALIESMP
jgi:hypothetical protein